MDRRDFITAAVATVGAAAFGVRSAIAQEFPTQPIKWIVPYPPGGGTDVLARTLADAMRVGLGQPMLVDNRPGAATNIAGEAVARSKPDGYTVMSADNAILTFNEHLFRKLPFNPDKDFSYIGAMGRFPLVLVVNPSFPARTVKELVDYVGKNPDRIPYASPGIGTPHHIAMELIKQRANLAMQHIAYKGQAPAMQDLFGGQVNVMFFDTPSGMQHITAGKVRPLAVGSTKRFALLPEVPTLAEAGLPDTEVFVLQGLLGPAGLPQNVLARLNTELNKALGDPAVNKRFADFGIEPVPGTPAQFRQLARAESVKWGRVIRTGKIELE
jgi:tripartite-type tricarboxylate transporter receptor subunit TctC